MAKKVLKWVGIALLALAALLVVFLIVMTVNEYEPKQMETLELRETDAVRELAAGDSLEVMTFNIGYGGLGRDEDFFMDGGKKVQPDSEETVRKNMEGVKQTITDNPADVYFIQEADLDSQRSYHIDEVELLMDGTDMNAAFAYNYNSAFVPYPVPPIGKVESGLLTMTGLDVADAQRYSLPVPFSWPVRMFNLKRCLLVERVPLAEGNELVLINLHLEAYDDGEGKAEQTKTLVNLLTKEYENGNYVIAGGDFNQTFPGMAYPEVDVENWAPGELDADMLPEGWQFATDGSVPTCRLLSKPYSGSYEDTQLYVIDGYIISPNVQLDDVETLDLGFENSDHHPVKLQITLKTEE